MSDNNKTDDAAASFLGMVFFLICIGISFAFGFGCYLGADTIKKEAIKHGYAYHNPISGDWQWKTNVVYTTPEK